MKSLGCTFKLITTLKHIERPNLIYYFNLIIESYKHGHELFSFFHLRNELSYNNLIEAV